MWLFCVRLLSRKVLASIILGVAGVLIMTWKIVRIPAHVVVINQSGTTMTHTTIETDAGRIELGAVNNGESRRLSVDATATLRMHYSDRGWTSPEPLTAGQSVVLYVMPDGRVDARRKLGTLSR
jgi:hypothetical protein